MWDATADMARFDEAVQWFRDRVALTADQINELDAVAKRDAFWVGAGFQLEQVQRAFDQIDSAIESGESFDEWRARVLDEGVFESPVHAEVVFRNGVQRSYNAGRVAQMRDPDVIEQRPYWSFDAILDGHSSTICPPLDGTTLPADDPFWRTHIPPLHHGCRSGIRSLRTSDAKRKGISDKAPKVAAADGFGLDPQDDDGEQLKPGRAGLDPTLSDELDRKAKRPPNYPKWK